MSRPAPPLPTSSPPWGEFSTSPTSQVDHDLSHSTIIVIIIHKINTQQSPTSKVDDVCALDPDHGDDRSQQQLLTIMAFKKQVNNHYNAIIISSVSL